MQTVDSSKRVLSFPDGELLMGRVPTALQLEDFSCLGPKQVIKPNLHKLLIRNLLMLNPSNYAYELTALALFLGVSWLTILFHKT